ncbi:Rha protein [Pseudomonas versuta]|uniref:Rha protein n=1 Tax=Pseudomonas versuta TaxID=1788301 RepID=A0A853ZZT6_9PSED|nr:Rha family transcriptional regulator [Pseudomonas versuta]OKA18153.1 Rha protein [Pseudomonas versuta]
MKELILSEAEFEQMVAADKGQVVTTSLRVAEYFGRAHGKVLRAIDNLGCSEKFRRANFGLTVSFRENPSGGAPIESRAYQMTKDGWMFLVMGFTGKKAAAIKEAFIAAFNWMAEQLLKRAIDFNAVRNELVLEYRHWKSVTSLAGRTMRSWQIRKPSIEGDMQALEHEGQYQLFHA